MPSFSPFFQRFQHYILLSVLLCTCSLAQAQLNFLAGYQYNRFSSDQLNSYLQDFNDTRTAEQDRFKDLNVLHGLGVGLRYQTKFVNFDLMYSIAGGNRKVQKRNVNEDLVTERQVLVSRNTYSLGVMPKYGKVGVGVTLDYNNYRIKSQKSGGIDAKQLSNTFGWASTFYLNLEVGAGSYAAFNIRPFIQYYWTSYSLFSTAQALAPNKHSQPTGQNYNFNAPVPGIMLLISNGPHKD